MDSTKSKNVVAKILQVYAYFNAAAGAILALILGSTAGGALAVICFALILVASFFIYALGEIIELLHQIKLNTSKDISEGTEEDLPEI